MLALRQVTVACAAGAAIACALVLAVARQAGAL